MADTIYGEIGDSAADVAAGKNIDQQHVNVTVGGAGDRTQVRLALLELQVSKTQRSQDLLSYAMIIFLAFVVVVAFWSVQQLGGIRQETRDQMALINEHLVRMEAKIQYWDRGAPDERP